MNQDMVNLNQSNNKLRICVIGMAHPCTTPRLVREVDTLMEEGHQVRVVFPSVSPDLAERDKSLLAKRQWNVDILDYRPTEHFGRSVYIRGKRKISEVIYNKFFKVNFFGRRAYIPILREMTQLASQEFADIYIGHTQRSLPITLASAKKWSTVSGFDCEDLLAELDAGDPPEIVTNLEREHLDHVAYVSTPSQTIADQLEATYQIHPPTVLYNVFPRSLVKDIPPPKDRPQNSILKLHWFSLTIGPKRGLETVIETIGILGEDAALYLRGSISPEYQHQLEQLAQNTGATGRLYFLPPIEHDLLIASMVEFDVGMACEIPERPGYDKTVTNKLFSYLLGGLAIAATDTAGQREVMQTVPQAGFIYPAHNAQSLAEQLQLWINDKTLLKEAKQFAWQAAQKQYCWDVEKQKFLDTIYRVTNYQS